MVREDIEHPLSARTGCRFHHLLAVSDRGLLDAVELDVVALMNWTARYAPVVTAS